MPTWQFPQYLPGGIDLNSKGAMGNQRACCFESKTGRYGKLFNKVMIAACLKDSLAKELPSDKQLAQRFAWFSKPIQRGLIEAGRNYVDHLLSEEQLALYRVLMRDAARFPELGRPYHQNFVQGRTSILPHTLEA